MPNLRVLELSDKVASLGKFRAVTFVDSEMYQIGEDADTADMAKTLCELEARGQDQLFQVYDDKGNAYL